MYKIFAAVAVLTLALSFQRNEPAGFVPDFEQAHRTFGCLGTMCAPRNGVRFVTAAHGTRTWPGNAATWTLEQ